MQIFVKSLDNSSIPFIIDSTSTPSSLRNQITENTGIRNFRLSYQGKELGYSEEDKLVNVLQRDCNVWLSIRLPGGGPKKRCTHRTSTTEQCSSQALRLTGECSLCLSIFCATHRLPEHHNCTGLDVAKETAWKENKEKLEREATGVSKLVGA